MKRVMSLFLVFITAIIFIIMPISASSDHNSVIPTETDYNISGGTITGLKADYLNTLTAEQKQNIILQLPNHINGVSVTAIGANAFQQSQYSNCRFTGLDLSQLTQLELIGEWCFYNCSSMQGNVILPDTLKKISAHAFDGCATLSGNLIIPNSVTTLDSYAFSGCKGLTGILQLSNQLVTISNYAFKDAGFTGTLDIPSSVQVIKDSAFRQSNGYNGFSGKLMIPNTVITIEKVAFSNQNAITDVVFSSQMTTISESLFNKCKGLNGVLEIPEHIQSIGSNAFSETNLKTVYLPEIKDQSSSNFMINSPFSNCDKLTAIICCQKDYSKIKDLLKNYSTVQKKLSYECQIQLQDNQQNQYQPLLKLYGLSYSYCKQEDKSWVKDSQYQFPQVIGDDEHTMAWSLAASSKKPVTPSTVVGTEKILYAFMTYADPIITFGEGIDKTYDGLPSTLNVHSSHPQAVNIDKAGEGDVVFYYTWRFATIGASDPIQEGFDLNTLALTDVYNPKFAISCDVTVMACYIEKNKAIPFYTVTHSYSYNMKQAEPIVHPQYANVVELKDGLPKIDLANADTKGKLVWDDHQTLQEGTHVYYWTFTPELNANGVANYKTMKGEAKITATVPRYLNLQVRSHGQGKVTPDGTSQILQGTTQVISILPDEGYWISSIMIDGEECLPQYYNHQLILNNIQNHHIIDIYFKKVTVEDMKTMIQQMPQISHHQSLTSKQVEQLLEMKYYYETIEGMKENISQTEKKEFNQLLMKLPQISVQSDVSILDDYNLLDNMTEEDIQILMNDPNASFMIDCHLEKTNQPLEISQIKNLIGIQILDCYNIQISKILSSHGKNYKTLLSELNLPIQLHFDIPPQVPSVMSHFERIYYVIRLHEVNGQSEITILKNQSQNSHYIQVLTNQFSFYAIAYQDIQIDNFENIDQTPQIDFSKETISSLKSQPTLRISTEDEVDITFMMSGILVSLVVIGILVLYKKK